MPMCCWLCGITIDSKFKRYQNRKALQEFILARCAPTPFVYNWLLSMPSLDQKDPVCVPCVNWKRRASKAHEKKRRATLQLDQMVYYLINPGKGQEPDQRCMTRLVVAMKQHSNPYRLAIPTPVHDILSRVAGDHVSLADVIASWWRYNDETEFFSNPSTARLVRSTQKV